MKSTFFQIALLIIFGGAILVGVLIFGGILPGFRAQKVGVADTVTVWGVAPRSQVLSIIDEININYESQFRLNYIEKKKGTIGAELLEALASDQAPDVVLATEDLVFNYRDKIYPLPFTTITKRQYQDNFVDGAKIFEASDGYLAVPVAVDPLVLYYNKDLYKLANIVTPPVSWEEFVSNQPKLTILDDLKRVQQSAVAMGTTNNITNVKDIFSMLSMQAGVSPLIFDGVNVFSGFGSSQDFNPAQLALDFYNQFSDPVKSTYSWNRTQTNDREAFLSGKLANYFGLASELPYFLQKNPHLNFDIAPVPRLNKGQNLTLGHFYGLMVLKRSTKVNTAFSAILASAFSSSKDSFSDALGVAPVKRISIKAGSADPRRQVFYREALVAQSWPDVDPVQTEALINQMIINSSTGKVPSAGAINKANDGLKILLKK